MIVTIRITEEEKGFRGVVEGLDDVSIFEKTVEKCLHLCKLVALKALLEKKSTDASFNPTSILFMASMVEPEKSEEVEEAPDLSKE